ncbi:tetratricopeptide repeat protein [Telmatobacter sp. DSM 110680]|uniref:Tetratricopeptide repeat protein n=1 Tax=Telmatobacter sp. DSM 110680 TaxID=3036704 RepID=A0AAU7DJ25_9BACT
MRAIACEGRKAATSAWVRPSVRDAWLFSAALLLTGVSHGAYATEQSPSSPKSSLQQHYDEAFRLQEEGDLARADAEHKVFLAMLLHQIANARANLGKYAHAVPVYDEALGLMPESIDLNLDYAGAALDGFDWGRAKTLASTTLELLKSSGQPADPAAISLLAQAMMGKGEYKEAVEQFKTLATLQPGFESSYALAGAYLALGDKANAAKIFSDIQGKFGDTADFHFKVGRLYGQATFYEDAIHEFKKAIAKNDLLPGAHFSLGATYMMQTGEPSYNEAEPELRKELAVDPRQPLTYIALGRIELIQRRFGDAESDLKRAIEFDPLSTAAYALLGQLYTELGKIDDAEAAFRKQIAITLVPAKNEYEVERAHFCLGRLLIKTGNLTEGRKELDISRDLLNEKAQQAESRLHGNTVFKLQDGKTHEANPEDVEALEKLESDAGHMIASSYDSLGVHAATAGDFGTAAGYFRRAAHWDFKLGNIDNKWGRAAFAAGDYSDAVGPLQRALALHPEDDGIRSMLGMSLFVIQDYAQVFQVLQPMEATLDAKTPVGLAYVGSMAIARNYEKGMAQLLSLETAHPEEEEIHRLIGEAYASRKLYRQASQELRTALRLQPTSAAAKFALARIDLDLGEKTQAQTLLSELARAGSKDDAVYYLLGHLQYQSGLIKAAVDNLETAVKLNKDNAAYHRELAEAYRKIDRPRDAESELQKSATLESKSTHTAPEQDPSPQSARTTQWR